VGGPNVTPPGDGPIADCVACAPGNPTHVLLTDQEAEHLPGCNMAFRRSALEAVGGFDEQFRVAGDDVDVCWRVRQRGWTLGFSPAAMVWHHRRNSVRGYLRQQLGYGRAETMLQRKYPEKHNDFGYWAWRGTIYGSGTTRPLPLRPTRVYHGTWGSAPFQSIYDPGPSTLLCLPLMPEWYLLVILSLALGLLGLVWEPMRPAWAVFGLSVAALAIQAVDSAAHSSPGATRLARRPRWKRIALTAFLHLAQPVARLWGRLQADRPSARAWLARSVRWPFPHERKVWTEQGRPAETRLATLEKRLRAAKLMVLRGGVFARWDLEVRGGRVGSMRLRMAVEDHGGGCQLVRVRMWPRLIRRTSAVILALGGLALWATLDGARGPAAILGVAAAVLSVIAVADCAHAAAVFHAGLSDPEVLEKDGAN